MVSVRFRKTGQECPYCGAATVLKDEHKSEKFCGNCNAVLTEHAQWSDADEDDDEWASFWGYRAEEYDGFYGPDRVKMPGGFAGAYEFD